MQHDEKQKLLRKLRSYKAARAGTVFLTIMAWLAVIGVLLTEGVESTAFAQIYGVGFISLAAVYICHLKVQLADMKIMFIDHPSSSPPK